MVKFLAVKHLNALRPADEAGEEALRTLGQGELIEIEMRHKRNLKHHRLFWATMSLVWEQLDHDTYRSVEDLVAEVKIITGHYDRRDLVVDGKRYPVLIPRSISFAKMDETEFSAFHEKVCDWIAQDVLPGVTREDLLTEIEAMTGMRSGLHA